MIRITKQERQALESVGLIRYRRQYGRQIVQDSNLVITNKDHVGKNCKTYYIVEEPNLMKFLGYYDNLNLQKITKEQFDTLVEKGLLKEDNIQHWGTFNPKAVCYEDQFGEYRINKNTQLMVALGLWKPNKYRNKPYVNRRQDVGVYDDAINAFDNGEPDHEANEFAEMFGIK